MSERALTDYEQEIVANVANYGCHLTTVFDPEGDQPSFSYSTGFAETLGQPEVIVWGLDPSLMAAMINETYRQCSEEGLVLKDWTQIDGLLGGGYPCFARAVDPSWIVRDYLNSAMWFHRRQTGTELKEVMQIVWPSVSEALFPWDENCPEDVVLAQTPMMQPRPEA